MDRDRLKQVQQTDLTDSKVNQDFVDWLKNKGPTYLLVILVVLVGFTLYQRWREGQARAVSEAYWNLDEAQQPSALELVASEHEGVGSVAELAKLRAADMHFVSVQARRDPNDPEAELSEEEVASRRQQALDLYQQVLEATRDNPEARPLAINALYGLAAVAESGDEADFDAAREYYEQIASLAGDDLAFLASHAEARLASIDRLKTFAGLPQPTDLPPGRLFDPLLEDIFGDLDSEGS